MIISSDYRWIELIYCQERLIQWQGQQYFELLDENIYLQAKGLGFMNQAKKDSVVDNNYKFAIYSVQLYAIVTMT